MEVAVSLSGRLVWRFISNNIFYLSRVLLIFKLSPRCAVYLILQLFFMFFVALSAEL